MIGIFKILGIVSGILGLSKVIGKNNQKKSSVFQNLFKAQLEHNSKRFDKYYLPCHRSLTLFCTGWLKDIDMAENVASDSLLKLIEKQDLETVKDIDAWLFTIAKNACLSLLSQNKRRKELIQQNVIEDLSTFTKKHQFEQENIDFVLKNTLTKKEINIWNLHQEGYKNDEISIQLNIPIKTIANLKSVARKKIKSQIKNGKI